MPTIRSSLGVVVALAASGVLLFSPVGLAQADGPRSALQELASDSTRPLRVRRESGAAPYLISGRIPFSKFSRASTAAGRARDFLAAYGEAFGLADPGAELRLLSQERDALGLTHLRFEQRYRGLPVLGRELRVHLDDEAVRSVNGDVTPGIDVPVEASVSPRAARGVALSSLAKLEGRRSKADPALVVFVDGAERPHLAWEVVVPTRRPLGLWKVFVNATSGAHVFSYNDLRAAKNRATYTNGNDADCNTGDAPQCVLPGVLKRNELACFPEPTCPDAVVNATHTNTGAVYDYYQLTHGRDSYDAAGHAMRSTVHFGSGFNNAFWCPDACAADFGSIVDGEQMVYGDGDGVVFSPLGQGLDVAAHELTHGVIDTTAGLQYFGQSGAQNESYADVFGVMVDRDDWLLGEDVYTPGTPGDALRSLADPTLFGQPGHMDDFVHTLYDNGGVHINSGIPNRAAYLTSEGPSYGVGRDDTEDIYYRALTFYVTPTTNFVLNLAYLLNAAEDLFGVGSPEARAVARAHAAVGIALPPAVVFPNGGENLAPESAQTATWSTEDTGVPFAVDLLRVSPATTYSQGFEGSALLPPEFTTGGDAPWAVTSATAGAGVRSARSGVIGHDQRSELSLMRTLSAPGTVNFLARLNTETNFDFLGFYVDGDLMVFGHGNTGGWVAAPSTPLGPGTHTLTWVYEKDETVAPPDDGVWIDNIVVTNTENVVRIPITAATAPGATSQSWTTPTEAGDYKVRVTSAGIVPWLASDDSNAVFRVGSPPPPLSIADPPPVLEGNSGTTNVPFTVSLSAPSAETVTINWNTANGTAVADSDFASASGQLTFTPGQTVKVVSVGVNGDTVDEPDETFAVILSSPDNATILDGLGQASITDDDEPPPPPAASVPPIVLPPPPLPPGCTQAGTAGPDLLRGTPGRDVICGLDGNDRIDGLGGNDVLFGGKGNDTLVGGGGRDTLWGEGGRDTLLARRGGRDTLLGGAQRDRGRWDGGVDRVRSVEQRLR